MAFAQSADLGDVVRLNNGALYRGTLVELVPGDHVIIAVPGSEPHRFEMSEVAYAGPIARDPQGVGDAPPPAATPPGAATWGQPPPEPPAQRPAAARDSRPARRDSGPFAVQFVSSADNIVLFLEGFTATLRGGIDEVVSRRELCAVPCTVDLPRGDHVLLARIGSAPVRRLGRITVTGDTVFGIRHVSRRTRRLAGGIVLGAGLAAGLAMIVPGVVGVGCSSPGECEGGRELEPALLGVGVVVAVASLFTGLTLAASRDRLSLVDDE